MNQKVEKLSKLPIKVTKRNSACRSDVSMDFCDDLFSVLVLDIEKAESSLGILKSHF